MRRRDEDTFVPVCPKCQLLETIAAAQRGIHRNTVQIESQNRGPKGVRTRWACGAWDTGTQTVHKRATIVLTKKPEKERRAGDCFKKPTTIYKRCKKVSTPQFSSSLVSPRLYTTTTNMRSLSILATLALAFLSTVHAALLIPRQVPSTSPLSPSTFVHAS